MRPRPARPVCLEERVRPQSPRRVRHLEEGHGGEEEGHEGGNPAGPPAGRRAPECEEVGAGVGGDHERHHGQPEPGHQDRAREEEAAVEDLDEEERGDAEGDRRRHRHRERTSEEGEEGGALGCPLLAAREAPVEGEKGAAQDHVHRDEVQQEGELQERPQKAKGRRLREGVGQGDHGAHGSSSVRGSSTSPGGAVSARPARCRASARRSSSLPAKGGISSRTCESRPISS